MLKHEFEERIGRKVTDAEYVEANAVYMTAGDIDKDDFCREWLQFGQSKLVQGLFQTAYRMNQAHQEDGLIIKETREMLSDAADVMIEQAEEALSTGPTLVAEELDKKAVWLIGRKEVALRKVRNGYTLTDADKEIIIKNLTK